MNESQSILGDVATEGIETIGYALEQGAQFAPGEDTKGTLAHGERELRGAIQKLNRWISKVTKVVVRKFCLTQIPNLRKL